MFWGGEKSSRKHYTGKLFEGSSTFVNTKQTLIDIMIRVNENYE